MKKSIHTIIALLLVLGVNAQANLDSLLVAHWLLHGDATDASGNGNHGIVMGPIPAPDMLGNADGAYSFDGVDDHIATPTLWNTSPEALTFTAWFRVPDTLPEGKLIYHGDNGEFQLLTIDSTVNASVHLTGNWVGAATPFTGDQWHFAAGRWVLGERIWIYLDGLMADSVEVAPQQLLDVGGQYLGALGSYNRTVAYFYGGALADVRIYSRALSLEELDLLYAEPFTTIDERTEQTGLFQVWPNPTDGNTTVAFQVSHEGPVTLRLIDPHGAVVYEHQGKSNTAGRQEVGFDASTLSFGTYFWELRSGSMIRARSMVVR